MEVSEELPMMGLLEVVEELLVLEIVVVLEGFQRS